MAEGCTKLIVNSACRVDRYLREPSWFKTNYLWMVFCSELLEWSYHLMFLMGAGIPPFKKTADLLGAKKLLYPSTIQTPEVKTDQLAWEHRSSCVHVTVKTKYFGQS